MSRTGLGRGHQTEAASCSQLRSPLRRRRQSAALPWAARDLDQSAWGNVQVGEGVAWRLPDSSTACSIGIVNQRSEEHAVQAVEERLRDRFPDVDPGVVKDVVHGSHAELTGPVRDFVPILVEHAARERLARTARAPGAPHAPVPGRGGDAVP